MKTFKLIFGLCLFVIAVSANAYQCQPHFVFCEDGTCKKLYYALGDKIREINESNSVIYDTENAYIVNVDADSVVADYTKSQSCNASNYYGVSIPYNAYIDLQEKHDKQCNKDKSNVLGLLAGVGMAACIVMTGGACAVPLLGTGIAGAAIGGGVVAGLAAGKLAELGKIGNMVCSVIAKTYEVR